MRILTTSDLNGVGGGIDVRLPVKPGMGADTGFPGAIGAAWGVGWAIGSFVGDNIDSYSTNADGLNTSGGGSCRAPQPEPESNNCNAAGDCY